MRNFLILSLCLALEFSKPCAVKKKKELSSGQGLFSSQQLEVTGIKQHLRLKVFLFPYILLHYLSCYKARAIDVNGTVGLAT